MPRDLVNFETTTKPIDKLIEVLRGPEPAWWDFSSCTTCAIEVAARCLGTERPMLHYQVAADISSLREALQMSEDDAEEIFLYAGMDPGIVRPRHVAESLELWRDTGRVVRAINFAIRDRRYAV